MEPVPRDENGAPSSNDSRYRLGDCFGQDLCSEIPAISSEATGAFLGARVLVVDSNPKARLELVKHLSGMGCEVKTCASTAVALCFLDEIYFDLLFLGTTSAEAAPEECARKLVNRAARCGLHVIALASTKVIYENDLFDRTYVTEYLERPYTAIALRSILRRQLESLGSVFASRESDALRVNIKGGVGLAVFKHLNGDMPTYLEHLKAFIKEQEGLPERLTLAFDERNYDLAEIEVSRCRISAFAVGAGELAESARRLELAIRSHAATAELEFRKKIVYLRLQKLILHFREQLVISGLQAEAVSPQGSRFSVIEYLKTLLENFDMDAVKYFEARSVTLKEVLGLHFAPLRNAIHGFDFRAALACLKRATER